MPVKPDGKLCTIREQIIEDQATGLTLQFEATPSGEIRLRIFGDILRFGNRDFAFDTHGELAGTGTATRGLCRPGWLTTVDD
jgi:hypothetical protein